MRVGIVTIYNSQNCGSFLQSLALLNFVKQLGYDTAIAKNNMYYKNKMPMDVLSIYVHEDECVGVTQQSLHYMTLQGTPFLGTI